VTGSGIYEPTATNQDGSSCADFDGSNFLGHMTLKVTWSSTVYIGPTKMAFGTDAGTVSGATTDTLTYGPGIATGSFPTSVATASFSTNIPAPGPGCPNHPRFSAFAFSGSLNP
jgi:hypothetical protein